MRKAYRTYIDTIIDYSEEDNISESKSKQINSGYSLNLCAKIHRA